MTSLVMNVEVLPRGSVGSHHPYAVQIRWYAITRGRDMNRNDSGWDCLREGRAKPQAAKEGSL